MQVTKLALAQKFPKTLSNHQQGRLPLKINYINLSWAYGSVQHNFMFHREKACIVYKKYYRLPSF